MVNQISRSTISFIRQLHQTKHRNETGLFIAEGEKIVHELFNSGLKIRFIVCLAGYYENHGGILPGGIEVHLASERDLSRISLLQTPNQVLAVVEKPAFQNAGFSEGGIFLLLDGIRDPGNMGTILRTSEWFGVRAVICSPDSVDVFSPKVVQGSMGSVFRMPVVYEDLEKVIKQFRETGKGEVTGAVLEGIPAADFKSRSAATALVIGSEAVGIRKEVSALLDHRVTIPAVPGSPVESLNAAVACGILLYAMTGK